MSNVTALRKTQPPVTTMDTVLITRERVVNWRLPAFQRPLRINDKMREIAQEIRSSGGVIPGVITLGVHGGVTYLVDGQHRLEAFRISELEEGLADVRTIEFKSMGEMADEFVRLNSPIVRVRPDDTLRALEESSTAMRKVRQACPFVGYASIRRGGDSGPVVSMSALLRVWNGAAQETPVASGTSAANLAHDLTEEEAQRLIEFLTVAYEAWGRGQDVTRLWGNLNLMLTAWLWRRLVLDTRRSGNNRVTVLKPGQFKKCLMSLAANADYADWLVGRNLGERDRSPCYTQLRTIFQKRMKEEGIENTRMPAPPWCGRY